MEHINCLKFSGLLKCNFTAIFGENLMTALKNQVISFTGKNLDVTAEQMIFVVQTTWRQADPLLRPEGGLPRILKEIPWKKIVGSSVSVI